MSHSGPTGHRGTPGIPGSNLTNIKSVIRDYNKALDAIYGENMVIDEHDTSKIGLIRGVHFLTRLQEAGVNYISIHGFSQPMSTNITYYLTNFINGNIANVHMPARLIDMVELDKNANLICRYLRD